MAMINKKQCAGSGYLSCALVLPTCFFQIDQVLLIRMGTVLVALWRNIRADGMSTGRACVHMCVSSSAMGRYGEV